MSQKQPTTLNNQSKYTVSNTLVNMYLTVMFSFFPLFLTDQYAHARKDKYHFYLIATGILVLSVGSIMLTQWFSNISDRSASSGKAKHDHLLLPLSLTDCFMLGFVGCAIISTCLSDYPAKAFWGTAGRNNGLFLLLFYLLMYFIITRNYVRKDYAFAVYLITSSFIALLTVLNFFYIDPLGMLDGYDEKTIMDFGSTIGNKNLIAAFMCIFLPVAVMLFVISKHKIVRIIAGVSVAFAYSGLLCADSTSDILGLIVILPVMAIFCSRSYDYMRRYLLALTILFASGKLLHLFALLIGDRNKGFEFMQEFLIYHPVMWIPLMACGIGYAVMQLSQTTHEARYTAKALQIILTALFSIGVISLVALFIHFSFYDKETDLGEFEKLLRFNDRWGTHRGFMWRASFKEYQKFSPLRRLFGSGPDTAYYVLEPHFPRLLAFGDSSTDCAHNEFINYLLTQGALGLTGYLGLTGSAIFRGLKTAKNDPTALVFICPVICYLAQSTVNLYNPIITPTMFIFLSLAEATSRNTEKAAL